LEGFLSDILKKTSLFIKICHRKLGELLIYIVFSIKGIFVWTKCLVWV